MAAIVMGHVGGEVGSSAPGHLKDFHGCHHDCVTGLVKLMDNTRLASCSFDKHIKVWDISSHSCQMTLSGHAEEITALIELNDGRLASGCTNGTIRIWNISTEGLGTCEITLESSSVLCLLQLKSLPVALPSPPGSPKTTKTSLPQVTGDFTDRICCGHQNGTITIWDISTGQCLQTLTGHSNMINSVIQLHDGRLCSCSTDKTVKLWDLHTNACVKTLKGHTSHVRCVCQLPDGRLCTGSGDQNIMIWDIKTVPNTSKTMTGHMNWVNCMVLLANGQLCTGSNDMTIKLWDIASGTCVKTLTGHSNHVRSLVQLEDGRICSGSGDGTIKTWE